MTWADDRTRLILILTSSSRDDSDAAVRYRSRRNHCQLHTRTTVIGISISNSLKRSDHQHDQAPRSDATSIVAVKYYDAADDAQ